jgi:hypothetical protein
MGGQRNIEREFAIAWQVTKRLRQESSFALMDNWGAIGVECPPVARDSMPSWQQALCCVDYRVHSEPGQLRLARPSSFPLPSWVAVARIFHGGREMKKQKAGWTLVVALLVCASGALAQDDAQTGTQAAASPSSNPQNIQAYIDLLRADVRQQKAEMVGAVMQLSAADAAKFWPIYEQYDVELAKLNDQRVANIGEYARAYNQMTDEKADELILKALSYRKQRSELLAKYYELVKGALGGITAARFIQVEDQLLLVIDLQIDSSLPVVGQTS